MISIVDYGLGNVRAFENIYKRLGLSLQIVKTASELNRASKIILPGVGAFDWALNRLHESGMTEELNNLVINKKLPVLGVCVGMQIMAHSSDEGKLPGLGWIDGEVKRFDETLLKQKTHLPHMGWNTVRTINSSRLFKGIHNPKYYFLHSYYLKLNDDKKVVGTSNYGIQFASAIESDNIFATQFHPEKGHELGIKLLKNFVDFC